MAPGRRLRVAAAYVGVGLAAALGSTLLFAGTLWRADRELVRVSRLSSPLPAFNPYYARSLEGLFFRTTSPRLRVGVQVGHLRVEDFPPEQRHLARGGGAVSGPYREVDINLAIAGELKSVLERGGIRVDLLHATVPPGYLADAVLAIHADGASTQARGWKIAAPWRASLAANLLLDSLTEIYGERTGLPLDKHGITAGMKGYYAFSPHRYRHAISPLTPAVIVETGFVTVDSDRQVIVRQPHTVAAALAAGLIGYFAHRPLAHTDQARISYLPRTYPPAVLVVPDLLRTHPGDDEAVVARLEVGVPVVPVRPLGEWTEVQVRGSWRRFGWIHTRSLGGR